MRCWIIGLVAGAAAATACDAGPTRPTEPFGTVAVAVTNQASSPSGATRLADVHRIAGGADRFLVTPRWSPDGHRLLLSGRRGVGLWVLDPDSAEPYSIDATQQGPAHWSPDGTSVAFAAHDTSNGWVVRELAGGAARLVERPSFVPPVLPSADVPAAAEVLFEDAVRRIAYEEYRGRLEAWDGGTRHVLAEEDAAGPRANRNGSRVAWWTGPLLDPTLHVADIDGRELFAGRGAHPAWLPDGERLVLAEPQAGPGPNGAPQVAGSDLVLLDLRDGSTIALTDTPSVVEMQPAVAPGGERLAFADWASGVILLGRLENGAGGAP